MRLDGVNTQRGNETSHRGKLVVLQGKASDFGGANGSKVSRVAEEDGPLALLPLAERVELAVGRVHGKVGDDVSEAEIAVCGFFRVEAHVGLGSGFDGGAHG